MDDDLPRGKSSSETILGSVYIYARNSAGYLFCVRGVSTQNTYDFNEQLSGESDSDENELTRPRPPARRRIDHALRFLVSQISEQKHG